MYQIICDNRDGKRPLILHDSRSSELRVLEPKCDLELNKTGSLTFKMYPTHRYFNKIQKLHSEISLYQDGKWIFTGRVLNDEVNIYNIKTIQCEGVLSYLLDSIQRNKEYTIKGDNQIGFKEYLTKVIDIHNQQVDDYKQFRVGYVNENIGYDEKTIYAISSYDDTLTTLNKNIIDNFKKTYLLVRIEDDAKYIDLKTSDDLDLNNQPIVFGKNILDFTRYVKGEEIATIIIPRGKSNGNTDTLSGESLEKKLDISGIANGEVNDQKGIYKKDDYVYDDEAVSKFGKIAKVVEYADIEDEKDLLNKAVKQLKYYRNLAISMELSALDLHLLDINIESISVGQKIRVISTPHNIDQKMIVNKISINLDSSDKSEITLITEERSLTDTNNKITNKSADNDIKNTNTNKRIDSLNPNNQIPKYFDSKIGTDDLTDLSRYALKNDVKEDLSKYALKSDVQESFDSLATLIREV